MSQRNQHVGEEIVVELKLKVTIDSFSTHNGFYEGQIQEAINEFKENIKKELGCKLVKDYRGEEFLDFVDFVNFKVENYDL